MKRKANCNQIKRCAPVCFWSQFVGTQKFNDVVVETRGFFIFSLLVCLLLYTSFLENMQPFHFIRRPRSKLILFVVTQRVQCIKS